MVDKHNKAQDPRAGVQAETENRPAGSRAEKHHVHRSYIAINSIRSIWIIIATFFIAIASVIGEAREYIGYAFRYLGFVGLALVFAIAIAVAISFIGYKRLTYSFGEDEINIYKGIIIKKQSHIPYTKIHAANFNAKILDRIFGVVSLTIDTAGGGNKGADGVIPALSLNEAEKIKADLFKRKHMQIEEIKTEKRGGNIMSGLGDASNDIRGLYGDEEVEDIAATCEYRLTNKSLILYSIDNLHVFVIITLIVTFAMEAYDFILSVNADLGRDMMGMAEDVANSGRVLLMIVVMGTIIFVLIVSMIARILPYGNFVARRVGDRIEVSRGLLEKKYKSVTIDRIQTFKIKRNLFHRIFGYAEIIVETAAGAQDNEPIGVVLHPMIKNAEVEEFIAGMLNEFADVPREGIKLSSKAMRRSIFRYSLYSFLVTGACILLISSIAFVDIPLIDKGSLIYFLLLVIPFAVLGWGAYKGRACKIENNYILICRGILSRNKTYVNRRKIQYAMVGQNPFQKRAGVATITVATASFGSRLVSLKDIGRDEAYDYLRWVEPKTNS